MERARRRIEKYKERSMLGITLVSLVVTIVVLLILAGITLTFIMGDNSVFNQASQAKIQTELGKIEEQAGIIYSNLITKQYQGEIEEVKTIDIINELIRNGNPIEIRNATEADIDVSLEPSEVKIDQKQTAKAKLVFKSSDDGNSYYVIIDGKYYKMKPDKGYITIEREATTPTGEKVDTAKLEVVTGYDTTIVTNVQIDEAENSVTITSGEKYGNTIVNLTYGTKTLNFTVTVEKEESDWAKIAKIAKEIAEGRTTQTVSRMSTQATVTIDGKQETITVGQEFYVKHNNILRKVRVLGFKHDILTNPTSQTDGYGTGTTATMAGISFEFAEFMIDTKKQMNLSNINTNGWSATEIRNFLEGLEGIGKISEVCRTNIKQVNKPYIKTYDEKNSVIDSTDKLWLLSCSEVGFPSSRTGAAYGSAIAKEGETYQYYQGSTNSKRIKKITSGEDNYWWLRSTGYTDFYFCTVTQEGESSFNDASNSLYVAPGFCI